MKRTKTLLVLKARAVVAHHYFKRLRILSKLLRGSIDGALRGFNEAN